MGMKGKWILPIFIGLLVLGMISSIPSAYAQLVSGEFVNAFNDGQFACPGGPALGGHGAGFIWVNGVKQPLPVDIDLRDENPACLAEFALEVEVNEDLTGDPCVTRARTEVTRPGGLPLYANPLQSLPLGFVGNAMEVNSNGPPLSASSPQSFVDGVEVPVIDFFGFGDGTVGVGPLSYTVGVDPANVPPGTLSIETRVDINNIGPPCVGVDSDGDGVLDNVDNCQFNPNPAQKDLDNDGIGDDCFDVATNINQPTSLADVFLSLGSFTVENSALFSIISQGLLSMDVSQNPLVVRDGGSVSVTGGGRIVGPVCMITGLSPFDGEQMVSPLRKPLVRFSLPVDPLTIDSSSISVKETVSGLPVPGSLVVTSTNLSVEFLPTTELPNDTEITLEVDGDVIICQNGTQLDGNVDGLPGGMASATFHTMDLTTIPGTAVFGSVFDAYSLNPIEGALVFGENIPSVMGITSPIGDFVLTDTPAPKFFVHVFGGAATNPPPGFYFPDVSVPTSSVAGTVTQLTKDSITFDVFLPPIYPTDAILLSPTQVTDVGVGPFGKSQLQVMFPSEDPAEWDKINLSVLPGSATDPLGFPAIDLILVPVHPDRMPGPLPSGLNPPFHISIQPPGVSFDPPAQISFPNLEGLAPGDVADIISFNHDIGQFVNIGPATVSEDGSVIVSDPGFGIVKSGWHAIG